MARHYNQNRSAAQDFLDATPGVNCMNGIIRGMVSMILSSEVDS